MLVPFGANGPPARVAGTLLASFLNQKTRGKKGDIKKVKRKPRFCIQGYATVSKIYQCNCSRYLASVC